MHGRVARWIGLVGLAVACGCAGDDAPEPTASTTPSLRIDPEFLDPTRRGVVRGVVRWEGTLPAEKAPHRPIVHPLAGGVRDAVVMLRGVGRSSEPKWPHGPVRVELRDKQIQIVQDERTAALGLARVGDEIEIVNGDQEHHALRGRGAAVFAVPLPQANLVAKRRLTRPGVVTLSSAANHPAMSAHLIVVDNAYVTRTSAQGEFELPSVAAGSYTLACWMPSGNVRQRERDPASGLVMRLHFDSPVERTQPIRVEAGQSVDASFVWSLNHFAKQ